jgi:hypothetical protein
MVFDKPDLNPGPARAFSIFRRPKIFLNEKGCGIAASVSRLIR